MATVAMLLKIEEDRVAETLTQAQEKLASADGELVLDFANVRRLDPSAIRALETLAERGDAQGIPIALRGLNVEVYKVLKLVRLASRLSFSN